MPITFIGMISHRLASEIIPPRAPIFDHDFIRDFSLAHERGGFDRILIGYYSNAPDGFLVAAHAAASTERIGMLLAHRPGFVAPTVAARKLATLDQLTRGRLALHVISGGSDLTRSSGDSVCTALSAPASALAIAFISSWRASISLVRTATPMNS